MRYFPRKLLLATDGSEDAVLAARAAGDLSVMTGAELDLVHVWQPLRFATHSFALPPEPYDLYEREARELLDEEAGRAHRCDATLADVHFVRGIRPTRSSSSRWKGVRD